MALEPTVLFVGKLEELHQIEHIVYRNVPGSILRFDHTHPPETDLNRSYFPRRTTYVQDYAAASATLWFA